MDLPDSVTIGRALLAVSSFSAAVATMWVRFQLHQLHRPRWLAAVDYAAVIAFLFVACLMGLAVLGPWEPTASEIRSALLWVLPFVVGWPSLRAALWLYREIRQAQGR